MPSNELKTLVKRLNDEFEVESNSCDCDVSTSWILVSRSKTYKTNITNTTDFKSQLNKDTSLSLGFYSPTTACSKFECDKFSRRSLNKPTVFAPVTNFQTMSPGVNEPVHLSNQNTAHSKVGIWHLFSIPFFENRVPSNSNLEFLVHHQRNFFNFLIMRTPEH